MLKYGVAATTEHFGILSGPSLGVIVDVGANRGQFSLAARHLHPMARIVAFEPLPGPAAKFARIFADDKSVTLHRVAIGTRRGPATIHLSRHMDSSSLLPITGTLTSTFPGTDEVGVDEVSVAPLTDFLKSEDLVSESFLKIDVQGFELEVLKSAGALLPLFKRIYVEVSYVPFYEAQALAPEVIGYLRSQGFREAGSYNESRDPANGAVVQADLLFVQDH